MATFERFEDIECWQKARVLRHRVSLAVRNKIFPHDRNMGTQMRDAAASVMSNIAEGYERDGKPEFTHFLSIAKGSAGEVRSFLYAAFDDGYLSEEQFGRLREMALEVSRMIAALMRYLRGSGIRGTKFHAPPAKIKASGAEIAPEAADERP